MNISFYTLGNQQIGMGHYYRTTVLAETALQRGHKITFYCDYPATIVGIHNVSIKSGQTKELIQEIHPNTPDWLIIDVPLPPSGLFRLDTKICLIDEKHIQADLSISQGVKGRYFAPKYSILPPILKEMAGLLKKYPPEKCWFAWGGASNQYGMLESFGRGIKEDAVLGVTGQTKELSCITRNKHLKVRTDERESFLKTIIECDRAVVQMGQIVWELLYLGIPTWVVSPTQRHLETAKSLERRGWVKAFPKVGLPKKQEWEKFLMSFKQKKADIDLRGAERIIQVVEDYQ